MEELVVNDRIDDAREIVLSEAQQEELKKFVGTQVLATATASLQDEVEEELKVPDVLTSVAFVTNLVL